MATQLVRICHKS